MALSSTVLWRIASTSSRFASLQVLHAYVSAIRRPIAGFERGPAVSVAPRRSFFRFVYEYQRAVTLSLGKYSSTKEPGIRLALPFLQQLFIVDMRTRVHELEPQHIMTKDNVSASVTAVVYYRVTDPRQAVLSVAEMDRAVSQLAATQMRDLLCALDFDSILVQRSHLGEQMVEHVRGQLEAWGVKVERVQMKKIDLVDANMIRAMAKEAEAYRDRKAAIIRADGEFEAARRLTEAAAIFGDDPVALELRRLQTLEKVAKEPSQHTVVVPMDFTQASLGLTSATLHAGNKNKQTAAAAATAAPGGNKKHLFEEGASR